MNNDKIVSPEKTGKPHFALAHEVVQPKSRKLDDHHIEQQQRHVSKYNYYIYSYLHSVYVPVKGKGV